MARKTTTSAEVKNRWNAAHYTRLTIMLDKDDAAEYKAKCEREGFSFSEIPKVAIYDYLNGEYQGKTVLLSDVKKALKKHGVDKDVVAAVLGELE